jgi:Fur family ferric uptake transcriptional regulator
MTQSRKPAEDSTVVQKLTKGCRSVLEVLQRSENLTSAQDIFSIMRQEEPSAPGLTTVYRSLESLVSLGLVQSVDVGDGEKRYEVVTPGEHHHHLICQSCNSSIHLDQCVLEDLERSIKTKYGFVVSSHVLEVFGTCRNCLKPGAKK